MKKNIARALCLVFFCTSCLYAIEPAFSSDVFKKSSLKFNKQMNSLSAIDSSDDDHLAEVLGILAIGGWLLNNFLCTFSDYPYAPEAPYVSFKIDTNKTYRFTFDTSLGYIRGNGLTAQASFRGYLYKFLGPYVEIEGTTFPVSLSAPDEPACIPSLEEIMDGDALYAKTKLGGIFSVFQVQAASLAWYMQWLYDFTAITETKSGRAYGLIFDSYPAKPLGFHLRLDHQELPDGYEVTQFDAQIGFLIKAWEIFIGYQCRDSNKYYEIVYDDYGSPMQKNNVYRGYTAGIRFHM